MFHPRARGGAELSDRLACDALLTDPAPPKIWGRQPVTGAGAEEGDAAFGRFGLPPPPPPSFQQI